MSKTWKSVVGYEGLYEVSSDGEVRSVKRTDSGGVPRGGFVMKRSTNCRSGYLDIYLSKNGKKKRIKIHVLVATAFNGEKPTPDSVCRHLDGDKTNNVSINLAWGSSKENSEDRDAHGKTARGEKNGGGSKLTEKQAADIRSRFNAGEIGTDLAREFGVSKGLIYHIKNGIIWSHV